MNVVADVVAALVPGIVPLQFAEAVFKLKDCLHSIP